MAEARLIGFACLDKLALTISPYICPSIAKTLFGPTETLRLLKTFFRQQLEAIPIEIGTQDPRSFSRFVI